MLKRCDNRIQKFVMRYSAAYLMGIVCRKKWGVGVGLFNYRIITGYYIYPHKLYKFR